MSAGWMSTGEMTSATATRLVLGGWCVAAPEPLLRLVGGRDREDAAVILVTRVLGARLLLQAVGDLWLGRRVRHVGIAVELTHAGSMLALARCRPAHRRTALVSAGAAISLALLDLQAG